jgi:hypothetical protein
MSLTELLALREVPPHDPSIQRATWFDITDPVQFTTPDACYRLHQTATGEWVRTRIT